MSADKIIINIEQQKLYLYQQDKLVKSYVISSSKYGTGQVAGSNKTPLGLHKIAKKFGNKATIGTIFKARANTGRIAKILTDKTKSKADNVTTRIMWLQGLERKNKNSYLRYIYIHGTDEEGFIGTPASHGCIRMKNTEVMELFNAVRVGVLVNIVEH
ncbi:MAG: L,D-transpeptidase [Gammaproteobacteria bacterium]|nr:MAG: L,D-transpeptidase [Gammaproteobacteria bacterium]